MSRRLLYIDVDVALPIPNDPKPDLPINLPELHRPAGRGASYIPFQKALLGPLLQVSAPSDLSKAQITPQNDTLFIKSISSPPPEFPDTCAVAPICGKPIYLERLSNQSNLAIRNDRRL